MRACPGVLAGLVSLLAAACGVPEGDYFGDVDEDPDPTHLRWCNTGEPEYIDPALTTSTTGVPLVRLMFDGLGQYDMDGNSTPSLAERYEVSADGRTFTFKLRDDAMWSNGRPLTAHDFHYHIRRVLQPETASRNADRLWRLKNGNLYNRGRVKLVTEDSPPFSEGDIVEVLGVAGHVDDDDYEVPNSNKRTSSETLHLRDLGAPVGEAYETVPAGARVSLIELGGDARDWAYVFYPLGGKSLGIYGWVDRDKLDGQPHGDVEYAVREVPPEHIPGESLPPDPDAERREGMVKGEALLMLPEVLGVRVEDDHTLVLETPRPTPYMISLMADRILRPSPREVVSRYPRRWTEPDKIVTSGPFHLTGWYERDRMEFEKSETYWDAESVKLERFTSYNMDDQAASANYYRTGGCDAVASNNVPGSYLPVLSGEKRDGEPYEDFSKAPYLGIYFIMINVDKYDNVHFRRALNYATDRTAIPRLTKAGETPTAQYNPGQPISRLTPAERELCGVEEGDDGVAIIIEPGELCYAPPPGLDFDPEKANEELALARQQMGDAFPETFTIKFNTGREAHKLIAEYLQHEWSEHLGLEVDLQSQEWKTFLKSTTHGDYDVARLGWIGPFPSPSEMLTIFRCEAPNNRTGWCNEDFERHFEAGLEERDHQRRLDHMRDAERALLQDPPIVPLYVYTQTHLKKPYLRDFPITFPDSVPMHRAWIDPNWEDRED